MVRTSSSSMFLACAVVEAARHVVERASLSSAIQDLYLKAQESSETGSADLRLYRRTLFKQLQQEATATSLLENKLSALIDTPGGHYGCAPI